LLNISAKILPYVFGVAFSLGSYTYVGAVLTLVISAWFLALNWKEVLKDKWSLIVIGFFLAITCKDAVAFVLKTESFTAFAKSGSRVFVLAGSAALLLSYPRNEIEHAFIVGYGIASAWIALAFVLMRLSIMPWIYNFNVFGNLSLWFPLLLGAKLTGAVISIDINNASAQDQKNQVQTQSQNVSQYINLTNAYWSYYNEDLSSSSQVIADFVHNNLTRQNALEAITPIFILESQIADAIQKITPPDKYLDYHNNMVNSIVSMQAYLLSLMKFYETGKTGYAVEASELFNKSIEFHDKAIESQILK